MHGCLKKHDSFRGLFCNLWNKGSAFTYSMLDKSSELITFIFSDCNMFLCCCIYSVSMFFSGLCSVNFLPVFCHLAFYSNGDSYELFLQFQICNLVRKLSSNALLTPLTRKFTFSMYCKTAKVLFFLKSAHKIAVWGSVYVYLLNLHPLLLSSTYCHWFMSVSTVGINILITK